MSSIDTNPASLVEKAKKSKGLVGRDLCSEVSTKKPYIFPGSEKNARKVAVIDCGIKTNQLRILSNLGCQLHVFPNQFKADDILALKPDGFFISNGPGDPEGVPETVKQLSRIIRTGLPTFGICFGHQLLGLAFGGKTFKLKFGHRGGNQPVIETATGRVDITSQNHGFAVDINSLPDDVETTHINLNDKTSEGQRHKKLPVFSVQYHPEAAPGPNDAAHLFDRFITMIDKKG
jgi:carbamoyl-phosphate synthase small subunit